MSRFNLSAATIVLIMMSEAAMAAPPSWQGTFFVTAVSSQCASSNNAVGEFGTILYRPILNAGDSPEGISLYFSRSAETIISNSKNGTFRGAAKYSGVEFGHNVYPNNFSGSSTMTIVPFNLSVSTNEISISGHINNFFNNNPECDIDFTASVLPRL